MESRLGLPEGGHPAAARLYPKAMMESAGSASHMAREGAGWGKLADLVQFGDDAGFLDGEQDEPQDQWPVITAQIPNHGVSLAPHRMLIHGTTAMLFPVLPPPPRRCLALHANRWLE